MMTWWWWWWWWRLIGGLRVERKKYALNGCSGYWVWCAWLDLAWLDLTWLDLVWLAWLDLTCSLSWLDLIWLELTWVGLTWFDLTGLTWFDLFIELTWLGVAWLDLIWLDLTWLDLTWLDLTWFVRLDLTYSLSCVLVLTWLDLTWFDFFIEFWVLVCRLSCLLHVNTCTRRSFLFCSFFCFYFVLFFFVFFCRILFSSSSTYCTYIDRTAVIRHVCTLYVRLVFYLFSSLSARRNGPGPVGVSE